MKIPKQTSRVNNIAKVILDAMNNYIIKDDTQVSKISVEKRYGDVDKVYVKVEEY